MDDTIKLLTERKHEILQAREYQLDINGLGWHGGRPYVEGRLSRFPAESDLDFYGGTRNDGSTVQGRQSRAYVIPHLGRIVEKINNYVFATVPERQNAEQWILDDIDSSGKGIDSLMGDVSDLLTVHGWCWLGVDAPYMPPDTQISMDQRARMKIRPYAKVWDALSVVDWKISDSGVVEWVLTESVEYVAADPRTPAMNKTVRRLWEPGLCTEIVIPESGEPEVSTMELSLTDKVPFLLVGTPSSDPHPFDDLESIERAILDLGSSSYANFYNCVYPQMYLPASVLDTVMSSYNVTAEAATKMIKGFSYPILLSEGDATPGYLMPDAGAIGSMREEMDKLKADLWEATGMLLRKEGRDAESAEAKLLDRLDLEMLVRARARTLEEAEMKLAMMMNAWDSSVPIWMPIYSKTAPEITPEQMRSDVGLENDSDTSA